MSNDPIKRFTRLVLFQAQQDHATELTITPSIPKRLINEALRPPGKSRQTLQFRDHLGQNVSRWRRHIVPGLSNFVSDGRVCLPISVGFFPTKNKPKLST